MSRARDIGNALSRLADYPDARDMLDALLESQTLLEQVRVQTANRTVSINEPSGIPVTGEEWIIVQ
ncbi:MAG TPA: hypothetical protein PLH48_18665 [Acinetobacter johnsonii]|nr:hypothetical protein [Acinetobacter johnsonii]